MITRPIENKKTKIFDYIKLLGKDVIVVSDGSGWVIDNISSNISKALNAKGIKSAVVSNFFLPFLTLLRGKTFYFVDRWIYLDKKNYDFFRKLSQNNKVIAMWWHSAANEDNVKLGKSIEILKSLLPYFETISIPCFIEKELLIEKGLPKNKLQVVPEGIESFFKKPTFEEKSFKRKELGIPESSFCIGFFQKDGSGWGEGLEPKLEKGPDIFIETIRRLSKKYNNIFVVLTGPARGYVKKRLVSIGVPFIHKYLKDYKDIVKYYSTLDLYLITSRTEGGPKSVLESLACGVPVVSTCVGMSKDVIEDNINGFLCEIENVEQLCKRVEALVSDKNLRDNFSRNGIETIKKYSWDNIADIFIGKCLPEKYSKFQRVN